MQRIKFTKEVDKSFALPCWIRWHFWFKKSGDQWNKCLVYSEIVLSVTVGKIAQSNSKSGFLEGAGGSMAC